jgi:hypothetical protein
MDGIVRRQAFPEELVHPSIGIIVDPYQLPAGPFKAGMVKQCKIVESELGACLLEERLQLRETGAGGSPLRETVGEAPHLHISH